MNNVFITAKKELRAIFRDKKFMAVIFLMPLIIPLYIVFMGFLYDDMDSMDKFKIGVNYQMSDVEKEIMKNIGNDLELVESENLDELKNKFNEGEINAYLTLEDGVYNLYVDTSNTEGMSITSLMNAYYEAYNNYLASNFLGEKGINPDDVFKIVKYEVKDQAKEGSSLFINILMSFALCYFIMIITVTAMNTSTDIIAGEKERGTFETLLTFPISSNEIIGGKLMAIVISCILSSLIGISTSIPAFYIVKTQTKMFKTMSIDFSFTTILASILVLVLVSCLVGVISIFLCGKAKTFKEAQSKVSILSFFSMIPMFTGLLNVSSDILYMLPIANGGSVLNDLFLKGFDPRTYTLFVVSSLVVTIVVAAIVSSQYKDEKALF